MQKVAVTGGAGFIGSNLVSRLVSEGYSVKVVEDFSTGLRSNLDDKNCSIYNQSIVDLSELEKSIGDCEVIFHLAARGSVPRSIKHPVATHEVNATGTLNVLEVARESGAHVVFSSSSLAYGKGAMGWGMASRGSKAIKELEREQNTRSTRMLRDGLDPALLDIAAFYRDVMMVQAGSNDGLINKELENEINTYATNNKPQATINKIGAIMEARVNWASTLRHC
jgi:hypothetical protein